MAAELFEKLPTFGKIIFTMGFGTAIAYAVSYAGYGFGMVFVWLFGCPG